MQLREIHVVSFGILANVHIRGLRSGLNVLHGPNEFGKTSLLEFSRRVLFGFPSRTTKANQYLLYNFAKQVSRAGVTRLNLGASPSDARGLIEYKEKWGGRTYTYNCYRRLSRLGRLL